MANKIVQEQRELAYELAKVVKKVTGKKSEALWFATCGEPYLALEGELWELDGRAEDHPVVQRARELYERVSRLP
ncbi:MAG: hypothetical protein LBI99_02635 [Propionibacteriaceae bacterium]|jgi:hypothetical protein|nr:hypothetical protein [Propionibacteriaceae bacterium]